MRTYIDINGLHSKLIEWNSMLELQILDIVKKMNAMTVKIEALEGQVKELKAEDDGK